jgi:mono/diheme cytochrome c family protein
VTRIRVALLLGLAGLGGCQQKMADQPSPRPYEEYSALPAGQSARPLEAGVVPRGQPAPDDPKVAWLTADGKNPKVSAEWKAAVDPEGKVAPPPGAPTDEKNFVAEFPWKMTEADLRRGQERFNIYCAVCHGASGAGNGKIVERGYLRPPSYHTDLAGKAKDWSIRPPEKTPDAEEAKLELPQGHSRGFGRYRKLVRLDKVPVGYIFQVITWGFGGMPDLGWQVPVDDRWRIIAYIRALQLSQNATVAELPPEAKQAAEQALNGGGDKKPAAPKAGH